MLALQPKLFKKTGRSPVLSSIFVDGRRYRFLVRYHSWERSQLEKNLVIWHHSGDAYFTWIVQFIRFVQLKLLENAKTTFVLRIYVDRHSALLPGLKDKGALPAGDLWAYGECL